MSEKTEVFLRLVAETAPLETGALASGESPPGAGESPQPAPWRDSCVLLDAKFKPDPAVWRAAIERASRVPLAAPIDPLAAMTAERDALRAAVRRYVAADDHLRVASGAYGAALIARAADPRNEALSDEVSRTSLEDDEAEHEMNCAVEALREIAK